MVVDLMEGCMLTNLFSVMESCVDCTLDAPDEDSARQSIRNCRRVTCRNWPYRVKAIETEYPAWILDHEGGGECE